jgi:3-oxoacyl-[acyl-carrier protein] reductase
MTMKLEGKVALVSGSGRGIGRAIAVKLAAERMVSLGRGGTPEEAAGAVFLFCTPESNYISGQTIVCGGCFMM